MLACGPAFFFSALLCPLPLPLPLRGRGWISSFLGSSSLPCSSTAAPRWLNRPCWGLRRCRFPTPSSKSHTGPHRCEFRFCSKNKFPLPLKGEGLDIILLGFALLVHSWLTRLQQGLPEVSLVSVPHLVP